MRRAYWVAAWTVGLFAALQLVLGANEPLGATVGRALYVVFSSTAVILMGRAATAARTAGDPDAAAWVSESVQRFTGYEAARLVNEPGSWSSRTHPLDATRVALDYRLGAARGELMVSTAGGLPTGRTDGLPTAQSVPTGTRRSW